jgi:hypothetical protein
MEKLRETDGLYEIGDQAASECTDIELRPTSRRHSRTLYPVASLHDLS